ncbi:MAG: N4-gp56 family major capsid protein [Ruminococcaceae bacterium]|nr:N4-gp56 family major capsid protein [Oscillospiraceae bacterium]
MSEVIKNNEATLSNDMRTYYKDYLCDNANENLVHDQFGQKHPIPKGNGKTIEFRKYSPLPKATKPLAEGITPDGQELKVSTVSSTVAQYGGWVGIPDMLELTTIDTNMVQATEILGDQAGRTLDTVTREVLNGGTNVMYAPIVKDGVTTNVSARSSLTADSKLSVDIILRAAAKLKNNLAKTINGSYVGIIHPFVAYDLMRSEEWMDAHKYSAPENLFNGEVGKIGNVRFVESNEAKIFRGEDLTAEARSLTVKASASAATQISVNEKISDDDAEKLVGRGIIVSGEFREVVSATAANAGSATITVDTPVTVTAGAVVYPGEGGQDGISVYSTLILGANAYGVTELENGGLEHIVKQLGSAGTADPLNQRASAGWKATKTAERLVENYMIRVESCSTFADEYAN